MFEQKIKNREQTRNHILRIAFQEISKHGFQGVSVNDIVKKAKLTKGAFFHYFPTKYHLGYAIADEILIEMTYERWIKPLAMYKNPVFGIINHHRIIIEATTEEEVGYGCPLNNLIQEMSAGDPIFRKKLQAVLKLWIKELTKYLKKAQDNGYIKKQTNIKEVAEFVVLAHEGAFGMAKAFNDKKMYWSTHHTMRKYLESLKAV